MTMLVVARGFSLVERLRAAFVLAAAMLFLVAPMARAQTENVEAEPIACWWRTGAGSIRIGEPFTVVLTCSLLETEAVRALADESRLEPSVLQAPPFEVVDGRRAKDVTTTGRRFLQYAYRMRLIAEGGFGREVSLPALQLTYRIEHRLARPRPGTPAEAVHGRDFTYALPPLPIRVQSLVPDTATDIREAPIATFDEIAERAFRASTLRIAALILFIVGGLTAAAALVGVVRRRRGTAAATGRDLPAPVVLAGVREELSAVQQARRESGWNADLAGRALAALRIAAAYASGRTVIQRHVGSDTPPRDGEIAVNGASGRVSRVKSRRWPGGKSRPLVALVSGSLTAESVTSDGSPSPRLVQASDVDAGLRQGLARFTAARYGRDSTFAARELDESLERSIDIVERLASHLRRRSWVR